jgi:hypothetical protein
MSQRAKGEIQNDDMIAKIVQTKLDTNQWGQCRYIPYPVTVQEGPYPSGGCYECPHCDLNVQICVKQAVLASTRSETLATTITRWYRPDQGKSPRETQWMRHMGPNVLDEKGYYPGNGVVRQECEKASGLS